MPIADRPRVLNIIRLYLYYQKNRIINKKDLMNSLTSKRYTAKLINETLESLSKDGIVAFENGSRIRLTEKGISRVKGLIDSGEWGREIMYTKMLLEQETDITQIGLYTNDSDAIEKELLKEYGIKLNDSMKYFSNDKLINILKRDILNAHKCLSNMLWKPAIILSGGIIEAIFLQEIKKQDASTIKKAFSQTNYSSKEFNKQKFQHLIAVVEQLKLFRTPLTRLSDIVRDFRNYVHIDKELKKEIIINKSYAKIAFLTMIEILKELNE